eukprot:jgi/Psemu1/45347/gm1.45347_g
MRFSSTSLLAAVAALAAPIASDASGHAVADANCQSLTTPIWKETIGNGEEFPYNEKAIEITSQDVDSVSFNVNQLWVEAGTPSLSVAFVSEETEQEMCTMESKSGGALVDYKSTTEYTAHCSHGYAEVGVYLYVGSKDTFIAEECESCAAPDNNYVGYYVALPCVPVCEPKTPDCITGPVVSLADIGHEPVCLYEENPIVTENFFFDSTGTSTVTFKVDNKWTPSGQSNTDISSISISYLSKDGTKKCDTFNTDSDFKETPTIEAKCDSDKTTTVLIAISGADLDHIASHVSDTCAPSTTGGASSTAYSHNAAHAYGTSGTSGHLPTRGLCPAEQARCQENRRKCVFVPPITITAQNVDEVTFTFEQTIDKSGIPMVALSYQDGISKYPTCDMKAPMAEYGYKKEVTAECIKGYAEVTLFMYVGDKKDFSEEDCEACKLSDETTNVAYDIVLPCTPLCEPEIPTCLDGPLVTLADIGDEEMCVYDDMPVKVDAASMKSTSVSFSVGNTWASGLDLMGVYISYSKEAGGTICETVDFTSSELFTASCVDGLTTVVISAVSVDISHVGGNIPSACGTDSTPPPVDVPSAPPVTSPPVTPPPVDVPSAPPATSPPVDCVQQSKPVVKKTGGNVSVYPDFVPPITITAQNVDEVTFTFEQTIDKSGIPMVALSYQDGISKYPTCDMKAPMAEYGYKKEVTAECIKGYAEVTLFMYVGDKKDFSEEDCEACKLSDETTNVAYDIVLPCTPLCEPEVPTCLDGPLVTLADIGDDEMCVYDDMPVKVDAASMKSTSVSFSVGNTWASGLDLMGVYISYSKEAGGTICETVDFTSSELFTAVCVDGLTTVVISAVSVDISHVGGNIPSACGTDVGSCSYEMVLPCTPALECGQPIPPPAGVPSTPPVSSSPTGMDKPDVEWPTTPAPSGSLYPSTAPSERPTMTITEGPSSSFYPSTAPTNNESFPPSTKSLAPATSPPVDCVEQSKPVVKKTGGNVSVYPDFVPPITITAQNVDEVTFTFEQTIDKSGIPMIALSYQDGISKYPTCDMKAPMAEYGYKKEVTAECIKGYAEVTLFMYVGDKKDFSEEDCEACTLTDETTNVAYDI